jgi:hypothetical protein
MTGHPITDALRLHMANQQSVMDVMRKTNWPLLREQKEQLLGLIWDDVTLEGNKLDAKQNEAMCGLLNWIDAIQDAAVDVDKIAKEEDVFNLIEENS